MFCFNFCTFMSKKQYRIYQPSCKNIVLRGNARKKGLKLSIFLENWKVFAVARLRCKLVWLWFKNRRNWFSVVILVISASSLWTTHLKECDTWMFALTGPIQLFTLGPILLNSPYHNKREHNWVSCKFL